MFPSSSLFHYPILKLLSDGKMHTRKESIDLTIEMLHISAEDQQVTTPGNNGKKGRNKVWSWNNYALSDLKNAEYIMHSNEGYIITKSGLDFYNSHKDGFMASEMKASEAYRKYKRIGEFSKNKKDKETKKEDSPKVQDTDTPKTGSGVEVPIVATISTIEQLEELANQINGSLSEKLLNAVKNIHPKSFEVLIKHLLLKMGYGKSTDDVVVTQYSKDGGIDGYVNADALGIKKLCCVQAKRFSDSVDVKVVRELVGSLAEYDCENGIIITTGHFTKGALEYSSKHYQILRVDGKMLADYMIKYGLGVATKKIEVKTVDTEYLNNL